MRMFFYFFFHSAWNQLRSFLRTWAFYLFLGLVGLGGILWYGLRWYLHRLAESNSELPTNMEEILKATHMTGLDLVELAFGLLILGLLAVQIIGAERSVSTLFKHADVNLLFASDLPPQRVLAFRVGNTLELPILAGLLLAIRLPFLAAKYGLGLYGALSILLAWFLTLCFSALLKILIYELGSRHPFFHRNLRWFVIALLAAVGYAFYRTYQVTLDANGQKDFFLTARAFFNAPATRWIPVWGWGKGIMRYALDGNTAFSVSLLCVSISLICVLILLVRRLPADYYEQTLRSAQEISQLYEAVNAEGAALLITRTKERTVTWDGFRHGWGSSVYFFRVFHNRLRNSRYFISKTMVTYCFAALAGGLYVRYFMEKPIDYIPVLVLAGMVFFRTIVSPVTEDIRKDTFQLQPEPVWAKLFYSLLGGSCNCGLDVFLPLMIGSAAAGFSPLRGLLYLPMLMSLDFFASASGVFTDVSIPPSVGVNFKQVIQIIFLYVGIIFDGVVLSYGINNGHSTAGFVLMTLLDLLFGGMFLGLTGVWLYPCKGRAVRDETLTPDRKKVHGAYARVGLALAVMLLSIRVVQLRLAQTDLDPLLILFPPIYCIGLPAFLLVLGRNREKREPPRSLSPGRFLPLIPACFFVMFTGNILGMLLQNLLGYYILPFPGEGLLQLDLPYSTDYQLIQALLLAFAAPVMEEFVFRRCVLDRLRPYGEKAALLISALLFALFHSAVNQMCYAFLLGLIFGTVYLKTGKLRYSMILHVLINSMTSLVLPALLEWAEDSLSAEGVELATAKLTDVIALPGVLVMLLYLALLLVLSLLGAVVFFFGVRERELSPNGARVKTALSSWGILLFLAASAALLLL